MRAILLLILLVSALVTGCMVWPSAFFAEKNDNPIAKISKIRQGFQEAYHPKFDLNLSELCRAGRDNSICDPQSAYPKTELFPLEEIRALYQYAETCRKTKISKNTVLKKAFQWHQYLCGEKALAPDFFQQGDSIHPSGSSYAWLAYQSGKREFSKEWVAKNIGSFHVLEFLREKELGGPGIELSPSQLQSLKNGENTVLTNAFVLLAETSQNTFITYKSYLRSEWDRYLARQELTFIQPSNGMECVFKEGLGCWKKNEKNQRWQKMALFGFSCTLVLAFILIWLGIKRAKERRREAAERLFTLQILTHELRTPTASLRLSLEEFRREFELLPANSQKAFLQVCDDLQRLDRVVEGSKDYLKSENKEIQIQQTEEYRLDLFLESILSAFEPKLEFRSERVEKLVRFNRYWLELCIKNLVQNALEHGAPPVKVLLYEQGSEIVISVQDSGNSMIEMEQMTIPFRKSEASKGLGLGLAIVKKVLENMGGTLRFSSSPTTFYLILRNK